MMVIMKGRGIKGYIMPKISPKFTIDNFSGK
jgi:hypothetical protein